MRSMGLGFVFLMLVVLACSGGISKFASAQDTGTQATGYAVKKPVFGGSGATGPWGAMGDIVKAALKPYGWDIQMCYSCAGGPRAARLVAGAVIPPQPRNPVGDYAAPKGPVDLGATSTEFLEWAYLGIHDFAKDPEGARKNLRLIANIQTPTYFVAAVKADSGITDLRQIAEKHMPVTVLTRGGMGEQLNETILGYYGLTDEKVKSFGGIHTESYSRGIKVDVILGFQGLIHADNYAFWPDLTERYDFKYLELAPDLREKLVKDFQMSEQNIPLNLLRGVDHPIRTVARNGTAVYGRTDMPDEFTYTLAKALDEHQDLFNWSHTFFSYNAHEVWKALDVPLHPGAARYYKEKGYMK